MADRSVVRTFERGFEDASMRALDSTSSLSSVDMAVLVILNDMDGLVSSVIAMK